MSELFWFSICECEKTKHTNMAPTTCSGHRYKSISIWKKVHGNHRNIPMGLSFMSDIIYHKPPGRTTYFIPKLPSTFLFQRNHHRTTIEWVWSNVFVCKVILWSFRCVSDQNVRLHSANSATEQPQNEICPRGKSMIVYNHSLNLEILSFRLLIPFHQRSENYTWSSRMSFVMNSINSSLITTLTDTRGKPPNCELLTLSLTFLTSV